MEKLLVDKERDIDDLLDRQTKSNDEVSNIMRDSQIMIREAAEKNERLESEILHVRDQIQKATA